MILDTGRTRLLLTLILIGAPLVLALLGNAALDPTFEGGVSWRSRLVQLIPRPYFSVFCWSAALLVIWAIWRRCAYAWLGRPRFRYDENGFSGLARKPTFLSWFNHVECGWKDVVSIRYVNTWNSRNPFLIYLKCRAERAAGSGLTATFLFVPKEMARLDLAAFFVLLDMKRPDLKDQMDAIFPSLAKGRGSSSSAARGSARRPAPRRFGTLEKHDRRG